MHGMRLLACVCARRCTDVRAAPQLYASTFDRLLPASSALPVAVRGAATAAKLRYAQLLEIAAGRLAHSAPGYVCSLESLWSAHPITLRVRTHARAHRYTADLSATRRTRETVGKIDEVTLCASWWWWWWWWWLAPRERLRSIAHMLCVHRAVAASY